jgi:hypothetical protein
MVKGKQQEEKVKRKLSKNGKVERIGRQLKRNYKRMVRRKNMKRE